MSGQAGKLSSSRTSAGSAWTSTASKASKVCDHLVDPRRRGGATQHVADRRDDPRCRRPVLRRVEQRHQLEAKLRAAEGKLLGQQDVGLLGLEQVEQLPRALRAKDFVERRAVELRQFLQPCDRPRAAAAVDGTARRRAPARRPARRPRPAARRSRRRPDRARQGRGAAQMADAQQVLHVEEDARAS